MLTETDVRPVGNGRIKEEIERQYDQGNKEDYGAGECAGKSNFFLAQKVRATSPAPSIPLNWSMAYDAKLAMIDANIQRHPLSTPNL
jgi:hypothetical protein